MGKPKPIDIPKTLARVRRTLQKVLDDPRATYELDSIYPAGTSESIEEIIDGLDYIIDYINDPRSYTSPG
tara:strand:+ start:985 stop:1194 length:210 start_codon:yes stop_codon:yes gene_type:complete